MKPIEGFNKYLISDLGVVFSVVSNMELKPRIDRYGYAAIVLRDSTGKKKNLFIHRLVAINYVNNPEKQSQVNHKDGNKLNNYFENLEWVSIAQNNRHKYTQLRSATSNHLFIHYSTNKRKWIAQPTINNKRLYKSFSSEIEAKDFVDELVVNQRNN